VLLESAVSSRGTGDIVIFPIGDANVMSSGSRRVHVPGSSIKVVQQ
jgi:hypothetical protein